MSIKRKKISCGFLVGLDNVLHQTLNPNRKKKIERGPVAEL